MVMKSFEDILARVKSTGNIRTVALVRAEDEHSQEAVFRAVNEGFVKAVYVGSRSAVKSTGEKIGNFINDEDIFDAESPEAAAELGVKLIHEGKADYLMKGKLETGELLKPVVNKTTGLNSGRIMSHVVINELPGYHKLLASSDAGMMTYPSLEQKKFITQNAVDTLVALGYEKPRVCVLAAIEKVNPKMPETLEAAALKEMAQTGEIHSCEVEGPISLDLAVSKEKALLKAYSSPCAGDADILIMPNIHAGNIFVKSLTELAGAKLAGLVVGAKCPIVLTSRASSAEEKYYSLILACAACG